MHADATRRCVHLVCSDLEGARSKYPIGLWIQPEGYTDGVNPSGTIYELGIVSLTQAWWGERPVTSQHATHAPNLVGLVATIYVMSRPRLAQSFGRAVGSTTSSSSFGAGSYAGPEPADWSAGRGRGLCAFVSIEQVCVRVRVPVSVCMPVCLCVCARIHSRMYACIIKGCAAASALGVPFSAHARPHEQLRRNHPLGRAPICTAADPPLTSCAEADATLKPCNHRKSEYGSKQLCD